MPELPEVIVIRNGLRNEIIGKKIVDLEIFSNHPLIPSKSHFNDFVVGNTITNVSNTAKLLVITLASSYHVVVHLKMTGNILYNTSDKYTKISFKLSDGSEVNYSTIRKLGFLEIWDDKKLEQYSQRYGKTVLESNLEPDEFISIAKGRKKSIRNTILDQSIISGVGNIYANEALFLTSINPKTMTNALSEQQLEKLLKNRKKVMKMGIEHGGSSIDRYKNIFGELGTQQDHFLVYGKKGQLCTQCKSCEILYEKYQGRGIYYCPNCQNNNEAANKK